MQKVLIYQIEMAHSGKQPLLQAGQDMDSDLDKDDNSEIILHASTRDTSRIIPGQTRDKYYLTYFSFYLLGIVVITPWSFFVTANDYWMYKFRDVNTNVSSFMNEKQTNLQVEFTSFLNVAASVPTLLFLILNIYLIKRVSLSARVLTVMIIMLFLFIMTVFFVTMNTDKWQEEFFVLTMVTMIVLNGCSAILSGSIFGIVGNFSAIYITAVNSGQSLGGIFAAIAEIISLAIGASSTHAAFVYFIIGSATIFLGIISYILMVNTIFFKYNIRVKSLEDYSDSSSSQFIKDVDYSLIFRKIWTIGVTCFMVLFTTTCVSPGVTVLVESEGKGHSKWSDIFFVPVINYLLFNVSDYIGRLSAGRFTKPKNLIVLVVLSFSRLIFVPLLLLCNAQPRHHLDVVFSRDYEFIIILALFALTNGYLVNAAVIKAPQLVEQHETEVALCIISVFIGFGMAFGSLSGYLIVKLL
ncbi:equilibrative nucleoside transporter 1-like isoform X1 [Harmonia axyridis]|uniref:equilibrative nucleoside transporter 1-like isoform X1 n=2 Tax=Harmonia axyridis TaxID=115357 RepID=UPI001E276560|nr:equilibrative nucleoside transporter 1-like isoform X1 [Harmonia axyridis]